MKFGFKLSKYFLKLAVSAIYFISVNNKSFCSLLYAFSHTLCGKLVCAWPYKTLVSQPNLSVIYTHVRDEICASAFLNAEKLPRDTFTTVQKPEDRDETFVEDGTICGPEMVIRSKNFKCFNNYILYLC